MANTKELLISELKSMGILNKTVLNALANIPRELFIASEKSNKAVKNLLNNKP